MGEEPNQPFQLSFNASWRVDSWGSRFTYDGGLILVRMSDEHLDRSNWSLTSLQQRLAKTGSWPTKHARYYSLLLAESHLTRRLFGTMVQLIRALAQNSFCDICGVLT